MPPTSRTSPSSAKPRPSTQTTPEQDGTSDHDDAIIVGSGTLAYGLAPSRKVPACVTRLRVGDHPLKRQPLG